MGQAVVSAGSESPYAPVFGLAGALIGGMLFGSVLEALGHGLRRRITPSLGMVTALAGAVLSTGVALGLVWLGGSVVLQAPQAQGLRDEVQRSSILRALNDVLPPSGPILNALARFDPFPRIDGPAGRPARAAGGDRPRPATCASRPAAWSRSRGRRAAWGWRARAGWPATGSW